MKERPILFSGPMVRAILEGRKTQTRRRIKRQRDMEFDINDPHFGPYWLSYATDAEGEAARVRCPYGSPGDRLWVRETWQAIHVSIDPETGWGDDMDVAKVIPKTNPNGYWNAVHAATDKQAHESKEDRGFAWRPSIFMPRWASRITLEITGIRVERLQQISETDALAEGTLEYVQWDSPDAKASWEGNAAYARGAFGGLWQSIHGPGSWDSNPWVWVVEFRRLITPTPLQP